MSGEQSLPYGGQCVHGCPYIGVPRERIHDCLNIIHVGLSQEPQAEVEDAGIAPRQSHNLHEGSVCAPVNAA